MGNAAINVHEQVFAWMCFSFLLGTYIPSRGTKVSHLRGKLAFPQILELPRPLLPLTSMRWPREASPHALMGTVTR